MAAFRPSAWRPISGGSRYRNPRTKETISRRQFLNKTRGVNVEQYRTIRQVTRLEAENPARLERAVYDYRRKHRSLSEQQVRLSPQFGAILRDLQSKDKRKVESALQLLGRPLTIAQFYLPRQT